jgi:hypothetical protein
MAKATASSSTTFPIVMRLAITRDDGGKTDNYHVYEGGGVVQMQNKRGELVSKNAIMGGMGTIYVANQLASGHDEFVLLPRKAFDLLTGGKK